MCVARPYFSFSHASTSSPDITFFPFISCQPLFYLFVNSVATEYRIVFLELHAVRRILFVLGGYIAGSAGHAGCLVFCALQYDLYAVTLDFLAILLAFLLLEFLLSLLP